MTNSSHNSASSGAGSKIFLVGFMGSGKTYWGRRWSQRYHLDFSDLDELIEKEQQRTISRIFEEDGEEQFRLMETSALKTFSGRDNFILACGGGTACFNNNMQWMNEQGTTVYLSASPQTIYDRVAAEKDKRPLIEKADQEDLLSFIEQKLKEREAFYSQAKLVLPAEKLNDNSLSRLKTYNL